MASGPAPAEDCAAARATRAALWAGRGAASTALLPLSWAFRGIVGLRRRLFREGVLASHSLPVPVIVVGNLLVGGAGKTPTVIAIVALLRRHGRTPGHRLPRLRPGGVGGARGRPPTARPRRVGDEPLLLARRTGVPVFVGSDRVAAGHALLQAHPAVDVIVSDDGLQHLALGRNIEVLVFDDRGTGNDRLLPAGPLREPLPRAAAAEPARALQRRRDVDAAAGLPRPAHRWPASPRSPTGGAASRRAPAALEALRGRKVVAAAGLARPAGFFAMLREHGLDVVELPLPDHHDFRALPWPVTTGDVVVSEKDAVKIDPARRIGSRIWVATLDFEPETAFDDALLALLPPATSHAPLADPHGNPPA